jgi:hypothetical protein
VSFSFAPQAAATLGYAVSAIICVLLLAFVLVGMARERRRPRAAGEPGPASLPTDRPSSMPLRRAALAALVGTLPLAFLFAARGALLIFPILTLILWRGVASRVLTAIAAVLLAVVIPILYVILSPRDRGGYNFEYSLDLIWAHWVGVAALILLMVACWRTLAAAYRARPPGEPPPGGDLRREPLTVAPRAPAAPRPAGSAPARSGARGAS